MTWNIKCSKLDNRSLLSNESLFSLGNGYLGVRGNFEEGYPETFKSIRGSYINAFHDETFINYGETMHGYPTTQQKLVNLIDAQTIRIWIDGEPFSLFTGKIISFTRHLHMDKGFAERIIHWKSPAGKEVKLHFCRLVSLTRKELFAIDVKIEPIYQDEIGEIEVLSEINGDVTNFVDPNDPRVASGDAKRLHVTEVRNLNQLSIVQNSTQATNLEVACVSNLAVKSGNCTYEHVVENKRIQIKMTFIGNDPIHITKYNIYTDTLRHGKAIVQKGIALQKDTSHLTFKALLHEQKSYLDEFWHVSDVKIGGEEKLQQGIRFNLYQLLQSAGRDSVSNIAAKGLSGEGYEGHYFWDTEIYMFPVFLMTQPDLARKLLLFRYSILEQARERALEMGHKKGALFPWRTISGTECSSYYPAGTAQYHINADIAYSFIQYYLVTQDKDFVERYMAEVLFETARLWLEVGHMKNGEFRINSVTGPDEYTCLINNNYYTNLMAKNNLIWAEKIYRKLEATNPSRLATLVDHLSLVESEPVMWKQAGDKMHLPYNAEKKINAQDDSFLTKEIWDLSKTPKEKLPLLLNYHPLTIYRYQVCKQADTVLAHFLLEDEQSYETMKNSYDYYEEITTHDSSLSSCVFSIMAAKFGYDEKAYNYFNETARLDLDDTHGNTKDGLHMANMGGTWMAIIFGFMGLRIKEKGLYFSPRLPKQWSSLDFRLRYRENLIHVAVNENDVNYKLEEGEKLIIYHHGEPVEL